MKLVKWLVIAVVLVLVLLVLGGVVVAVRANTLAKRGIERGATYALGVNTTLDGASVGLLSGELKLDDLEIANPQGFPSPRFLSMGSGEVDVTLPTLLEQTIEVPKLELKNIEVNLDRKEGRGNYNVILENLKKVSGPDGQPEPTPTGDEKRLIINVLTIEDVTVNVDPVGGAGAIGQLARIRVPIEKVQLSDVGRTGSGVGGTGVTVSELSSIVVQAVLAAAAEKGGDIIPGEILGDLKGKLAALGDLEGLKAQYVGEAAKAAEKIQEEAKKAVDEKIEEGKKKVEEIGKDLGGLLNRGDKKKDDGKK